MIDTLSTVSCLTRSAKWVGVLDGVVIVKGEETVLGVNFGRPIVTNGDFAA